MRLRVNGQDREVPEGETLAHLLSSLELPTGRVAVERNGDIVPRDRFEGTVLAVGDRLEIVQFVGGG